MPGAPWRRNSQTRTLCLLARAFRSSKVVGAKLTRNCVLYETLPTIKYVFKTKVVQNIVRFAG